MLRILLTGGGTGGHIYPLCAVVDELHKLDSSLDLIYLGPQSSWNKALSDRKVTLYVIPGAKWRRYSYGLVSNLLDIPKFFFAFIKSLWRIYFMMPDVVFSKGGTSALPVVMAARWYRIPVLIHESDAIPGLTNQISSTFATRIGISFQGAASYFPSNKIALVGNPVRGDLWNVPHAIPKEVAKERLGFDKNAPLILFLGGSQGAAPLNDFVYENRDELLKIGNIFHQMGEGNSDASREVSGKYKVAAHLNLDEMRDALIAADVVISRAGGSAIYEIAAFGKPSILIPLDRAARDHQRANAYEYAKGGASIIIEETNLNFGIMSLEIRKILGDIELQNTMQKSALQFFKPHAAETIAKEIITLGSRQ